MEPMEIMNYQVGDKTYVLSALTVGDLTAYRDYLRKRKIDFIRQAFDGMPEKSEQLQKAITVPISEEEVKTSSTDPESLKFMFHRSISKKHPEVTLARAEELLPLGKLNETAGIIGALMGVKQSEGDEANPPVPPANK